MNNKEIPQFIEQMAKLIDLPIEPEHLPGVLENLTRITQIAKQVNDFPLPEDIETATVFKP